MDELKVSCLVIAYLKVQHPFWNHPPLKLQVLLINPLRNTNDKIQPHKQITINFYATHFFSFVSFNFFIFNIFFTSLLNSLLNSNAQSRISMRKKWENSYLIKKQYQNPNKKKWQHKEDEKIMCVSMHVFHTKIQ